MLESSQHTAQSLREVNRCKLTATANDNHSRSHYCVCVLVCEYMEKGIKKTRQTPTQEYNRKREIDVLGRRGIRIQVQKEKSRRKRR